MTTDDEKPRTVIDITPRLKAVAGEPTCGITRTFKNSCTHDRIELSVYERVVTCAKCSAVLDPFEALLRISHHWERWDTSRKQAASRAADAQKKLDDLLRQIANARATLRRTVSK